MSYIGWRSRLLSVAPRVVTGTGWMLASTHPLWVLLSFGSYRRQLHVDGNQQRLWLRERAFWRTRVTQIAFDTIDHIEYVYQGMGTSFIWTSNAGRLGVRTADNLERFGVSLKLKNGESLQLFSFLGEGAVFTGVSGALLGDSWVDLEGAQEDESRAFVTELQRLTSLRLGPALLQPDGPRCAACGRANARRSKCLYCGATLSGSPAQIP
jgi:hypothetical protein